MISVFLDGSSHLQGQLIEIRKGFVELGCEVTDFVGCADLIYSNNPSPTRTQIVCDIKEGKTKKGAKFIACIQDYPLHLENTESFQKEIPQIKADLAAADAICSISEYTRGMVKEKYGFDSTVVYNPIKPVCLSPYVKRDKFAIIPGRKYDKNKNLAPVIHSLQMLSVPEEQVLMVGNESVGWGSYQGVLSDENLSHAYNSAFFCFCMGEIEGLSLVPIESAACGTIPVINCALTTRQELFPSTLFPEYDSVKADPISIANFIARFSQDDGAREDLRERLIRHYNDNLKEKFSSIGVAQRIINLYNSL